MNRFTLVCLFLILFSGIYAQNKKTLTTSDYDHWNDLKAQKISANGKFVSFEINPQKGDGNLFIKDISGKEIARIPRGKRGKFTFSSEYFICRIKPQHELLRQKELDGVKKKKFPKDTLAMVNLKTGEIRKIADIKSFKLAAEGKNWLAVEKSLKDTAKKEFSELWVFDLAKTDTLKYKNPKNFEWSKTGLRLAIHNEAKDSTKLQFVHVLNTDSGKSSEIYQAKSEIESICLDEAGKQMAFFNSLDTTKHKAFDIYYWTEGKNKAELLISKETVGMPKGDCPSKNSSLAFNKDASRLFFGTAAIPVEEKKDSLTKDEKVIVDLWSWTDNLLIPQQKVQLKREQRRTYTTFWDFKKQEFTQVEDKFYKSALVPNERKANFAIAKVTEPYEKQLSWDYPLGADLYKIDLKSRKQTKLAENLKSGYRISPKGKYILYFDGASKQWCSISTASGFKQVLTEDINIAFQQENWDYPSNPDAYGFAAWGENDAYALVYDKFDIWKLDLSGQTKPLCITNGKGRKSAVRYRYRNTHRDRKFLEKGDRMLIHGMNTENYHESFMEMKAGTWKKQTQLITENFKLRFIAMSKNEKEYIWTKESYVKYPDLWVSNTSFKKAKELSNTNPQQKDYTWGSVEAISWYNANGDLNKGLLYKPENFDPNKKYPMMVYFYRLNSDNFHKHYGHFAHRSIVIPTLYNSDDYLFFVPDVHFKEGTPGPSSKDCIISGVNYLMNRGYVNKDAIGVQGQSWGGYQTAYLVTQTDIFKAAMSGAPVSNMTSAYGGIRWASGMSRMFQYEQGQSRIGGTLWDRPLEYINNSPIFFANKINTPVLMRHDDADGAVPWYQGIEMFVAMRRLNKPVWMLNYNAEPHNLKRRANMIDFAIRMKQFFDHYLKGAPAPKWMIEGIPYTQKGKTMGYELVK